MDLRTHSRDGVTVLELAGRFDAYVAPNVNAWFDTTVGASPARLVVNLSAVSFMDSTALGALLRGLKRCRQGGGDLHVAGLQSPVRIVFELTRLDRVFKIYGSEEEAIRAFGTADAPT